MAGAARRRKREPDKKKKKQPKPKGGGVNDTGPPASSSQGPGDTGEMDISASTAAPTSAAEDQAADTSDDNMQAFFSSGSGPAYHYDAGMDSSAGGAGPDASAEAASGSVT
jgi:hypothetical protein